MFSDGKQNKWPVFCKGPCSFLLTAPLQAQPDTVNSKIVRELPSNAAVLLLCDSAAGVYDPPSWVTMMDLELPGATFVLYTRGKEVSERFHQSL